RTLAAPPREGCTVHRKLRGAWGLNARDARPTRAPLEGVERPSVIKRRFTAWLCRSSAPSRAPEQRPDVEQTQRGRCDSKRAAEDDQDEQRRGDRAHEALREQRA